MAVITLTTDLGLKDYYTGAVKGALISQVPDVTIVDISHDIRKYNIPEAAFTLKNAFAEFPKGSIHIVGVQPELKEDPELKSDIVHILVSYKGHYFIGADNGVFSLIFDEPVDKIYELTLKQERDSITFPVRDVFVPAAAHLSRGGVPEVIGKPKENLIVKEDFEATVDGDTIRGGVIYVDDYGNVITNITQGLFEHVRRGRDFQIMTRVRGYDIKKISQTYSEVPAGERLALFGSSGHLEIAINIGPASDLLGLKVNDVIRVQFME